MMRDRATGPKTWLNATRLFMCQIFGFGGKEKRKDRGWRQLKIDRGELRIWKGVNSKHVISWEWSGPPLFWSSK